MAVALTLFSSTRSGDTGHINCVNSFMIPILCKTFLALDDVEGQTLQLFIHRKSNQDKYKEPTTGRFRIILTNSCINEKEEKLD